MTAAEQFADPEYRVEGPLKVTGRARYAADVALPGMLWARFHMSSVPHAKILSVDASAALAVPGVHAVLTGQDIGPRRFGKVLYDWPVLAFDRVRFVGERVAAVAAESRDAAEEAASLIRVEYEELPAVFDAEAALSPDAPVLHPDAAEYYYASGLRPPVPHANVQGYRLIEKGDGEIEAAFARAYRIVEDVFMAARQHQGYIEPHACVVWIGEDGMVRVYSTNKSPFSLRQQLARVTGRPSENIVVDAMFIGGDFGGKGTSMDEFACYYLALAAGRPVKSVMSYADEMVANPRHGAKAYLRTGVSADGRILAHQSRVFYDDGAYAACRPLAGPILDGWSGLELYRVPHAKLETFVVYTNEVPGGQMRAPGAAHTAFIGEAHVEHLARELGIDSLDFRIRNAIREGDTTITGDRVRNPRAVEVLETLQRETSWDRGIGGHGDGAILGDANGLAASPRLVGRGVVLRSRDVGSGRAEVVFRLLADGSVEALHGAPDQGGGSAMVVRRVATATLSIASERIRVRYGTTADAPFNPGAGGSRLTHVLGRATVEGATALKEKLEDLAAEVMGWPAGAVRLVSDQFRVTSSGSSDGSEPGAHNSELRAPFAEVAQKIAAGPVVEAVGSYDSADHLHEDGDDCNFCAYMVEVEVDPDTGQVIPRDALLVVDVGTIINPLGHQGQLEGGFVFGLGNALMEELVFDDGKLVTANLGDYKLPTQMDVPPLRTVLLPTDIGPGPFGAKAAGELVNNAVLPAIVNAVWDATGVRVTEIPVTAERVLEALRRARAAT